MSTATTATCPFGSIGGEYRPFDHEGMYEFLARARRVEPVFYNPELDCWVVTKREDAIAIFKDPATYSASNSQTPIVPVPEEVTALLAEHGYRREPTQANCDPPKHTRIRRAAQKFLNPKRFRALEPEIRALVEDYVAGFGDVEEIDLVDALTYELPARVVFLLLGISDVDARQVKEWSDNRFTMVWGKIPPTEAMAAGRQLLDYWNYCSQVVADRLEHRGDDYASALLAIRDGDDSVLTVNEIVNLVFGILLAGHETTTNGLSNLILELLRTGQWARLVDDPSAIPAAVEEGLRFAPPFITWRRLTTKAVEIRGVAIPAGATILVSMASANRDEDHYPEPESFDVGRGDTTHLSFGLGIHFCLGAALARIEMVVAVEELVRSFPALALVADQEFDWEPTISFRGPSRLLVRPRG